jgi:uncharacterized protein DUF3306
VADTGKPMPAEAPVDSAGDGTQEAFLSRWSRLKQEARDRPGEQPPFKLKTPDHDAPPPELPPLDKLTMDSDYRSFFHPKVNEDVRRAALKKLFSDPHFNVMDGLDVYIDDYSKTEPIPAAMLASLRQAQNILQWAKEDTEQREKEQREKEQREKEQREKEQTEREQSPAVAETVQTTPQTTLRPPAIPSAPEGVIPASPPDVVPIASSGPGKRTKS